MRIMIFANIIRPSDSKNIRKVNFRNVFHAGLCDLHYPLLDFLAA